MSGSAIFLLAAVLLLGAQTAVAQTAPIDRLATQTTPEMAGIGTLQGNQADRAHEGRAPADGERAPVNPPEKDETVGVGGSIDVAPRDIREPFDE